MGNEPPSSGSEEERDIVTPHFLVPSDFPQNTKQVHISTPFIHPAQVTLHDACLKNNKSLQVFLTDICSRFPEDAAELLKSKDGLQCLPFHFAVAGGHTEAISALAEKYLKFGIFSSPEELVNHPAVHNSTSLHIAIVAGHLDVVKLLISMGADTTRKTSSLATPLHIACAYGDLKTEGGSLEMVKLMIDGGCDVNAITEGKETALDVAVTFTMDAPNSLAQQEEIANFLMEQPKIDLSLCGEDSSPLLHEAAEKGFITIIKKFLLQPGLLVDQLNKEGDSALHVATKAGNKQSVKLLIESKATIDLPNSKKQTPLAIAVATGNEELTKLFIDAKADVNHITGDGSSLLCISSRLDKTGITKILLDAGANPLLVDSEKNTPLHLISSLKSHHKMARLLLQNSKNINDKNSSGHTPLFIASSSGNNKMVQVLLAHSALVDETTPAGETALHIAAAHGSVETMKHLLNAKAQVNLLTAKGLSPLDLCVDNSCKEGVRLLLSKNASVSTELVERAISLGVREIIEMLTTQDT